jgi:hypothetical protein
MRTEFHGITSIGLTMFAIAIASVAAFLTSWVLGVLYLAICAVSLAAILFAFCAKCPCQLHCGHVIPGKLAALVSRQPGPYSKLETAVVVVALLLLVGLPQLWLWQYLRLLTAFWALTVVAVAGIRTFVCRACENVYCPAKAGS